MKAVVAMSQDELKHYHTITMKTNITKIIETVVLVISIAFILWVFASWAEVVSKNLKPNPTYSEWNAFVLITKGDR